MFFWNKKIINLKDKYFGLDLSDSSVKVFQLEKNGALDSVRSFSSKKINPGLVENGKIIDQEKVIQAIKEAIATAGPKKINTKKVICSIPESKVFLRIISIPRISQEEAGEAIKWEIEANIPLAVDQVYYDWHFLDQVDGKQNVLTIAVAKEVVDELSLALEKCGLEVHGFEMESIATVRSLISFKQEKGEDQTCLIVDIGGEKTSFIITKGDILHFTSSIPFSSIGITDVIASQMKITREEAEKIKANQGIEHDSENDPVFNSVRPFLENLSTEIEKTIDFYNNLSKNPAEINKIIISGGGANLKGLTTYLAERLSREVVLGVPWINLNLGKDLPPISKNDSACFATVAGLAMRESDSSARLNLISPERKEIIAKKNRLRLVLRLETVVTGMLVIFLAVLGSFWYILYLGLSAQSFAGQNNAKSAQYEKIKGYDEKFAQTNAEIAKIMTVKKDQLYWSVIFSKLNELVFPGISVKSLSTSDYAISLLGVAGAREDLILFKEKLEGESCFSAVNLPLSNLVEKNNFEFQIDFSISKDCLQKK